MGERNLFNGDLFSATPIPINARSNICNTSFISN